MFIFVQENFSGFFLPYVGKEASSGDRFGVVQDGAILPARDTGFVPQGKFIMFWRFISYYKMFD